MFILQVAAIALIISTLKSSGVSGSNLFSRIANCTDYKNCIHPFEKCDAKTGACQLASRTSSYPAMWDNSNFELSFYRGKYTYAVCSEDGLYPSPDCRYFYQCFNGTSVLKTCDSPGFPYFDPVQERCTSTSTCPTFQCSQRFGVRVGLEGQLTPFFAYCFHPKLVYGGDRNGDLYLLYTFKNVFLPFVVTRCYGKDILNANTGRCEPRCLHEGLLPDTTDCHHYFLCSLQDPINSVFKMIRLSCPKGQAFLSREHRCVPQERVSPCTMPRAWPM